MNLSDRVREATHSYVGFAKCGCARAVCVDLGDKHTASSVAEWISSGYVVVRMTREEFKLLSFGFNCPHSEEQHDLFLAPKTKP